MKKLFYTLIITALVAGLCTAVYAGSYNSGALTSSTLVYPSSGSGSGTVTAVYCVPDGTHACTCTVYDNTAASGKQIKGAVAAATASNGWIAGSVDAAPTFGTGIYVVPAANSTRFVEYELKR